MNKLSTNKEFTFRWSIVPTTPSHWATVTSFRDRGDIFPPANLFVYFDGKMQTAYMDIETVDHHKNVTSKKYLDPDYFKEYEKKYEKERKVWWDWIREIERKKASDFSKNQLAKVFAKYTDYMTDSMAYFGSTRLEFTYACEQRLIEIVKKIHAKNWVDVFGELSTPVMLDEIQVEQLDFIKILNSGITDKKLLEHASKYPWLMFCKYDEQEALEFLKGLSKEFNDLNFDEREKELKKDKDELKKKQKDFFRNIKNEKIRKEAEYLAYFIQIQGVRRMQVKAYWGGCPYLARGMWHAISKELDVSIDDIFWYIFPNEIQAFLDNTSKDDVHKLVEKRKHGYSLYYPVGGKIQIIEEPDSSKFFHEFIEPKKHLEDVIKGQTASPGIYTGKVRKVIAGGVEDIKESIKNFKKGEILVTSMTQPNMMVIAQRAGAIVADEGGITSHAAIISRELKIPCIVGCLHAMYVLKDGDTVEVDADKGIVRKIK